MNAQSIVKLTGTVAVLAVYILQIPSLGTVDVGNGLEWFFYILLPNFCFNKALQDMYSNYQYGTICSGIDKVINRTTFCGFIANGNYTNLCCDSELRIVLKCTVVLVSRS